MDGRSGFDCPGSRLTTGYDRMAHQGTELVGMGIMTRASFGRRLIDGATMFVVTGLSLLLLVYVGFGEGKRVYEQFQVEKLVAHSRIVQNAMENYLRAGLPLKQYAGFANLADPIVQGIDEIDAMVVYDHAGHQLFVVTDKDKQNPKLPEPQELA